MKHPHKTGERPSLNDDRSAVASVKPSPEEAHSGGLAVVASLSFEAAMEELDGWVHRLESGELSLDDSIAAYRRAAELAQHCQARLQVADQEIRKLDGELLTPIERSELRGGGA